MHLFPLTIAVNKFKVKRIHHFYSVSSEIQFQPKEKRTDLIFQLRSMSHKVKVVKCQFQLCPVWVEWELYDLLVKWLTYYGLSELKINVIYFRIYEVRRFQMFHSIEYNKINVCVCRGSKNAFAKNDGFVSNMRWFEFLN